MLSYTHKATHIFVDTHTEGGFACAFLDIDLAVPMVLDYGSAYDGSGRRSGVRSVTLPPPHPDVARLLDRIAAGQGMYESTTTTTTTTTTTPSLI